MHWWLITSSLFVWLAVTGTAAIDELKDPDPELLQVNEVRQWDTVTSHFDNCTVKIFERHNVTSYFVYRTTSTQYVTASATSTRSLHGEAAHKVDEPSTSIISGLATFKSTLSGILAYALFWATIISLVALLITLLMLFCTLKNAMREAGLPIPESEFLKPIRFMGQADVLLFLVWMVFTPFCHDVELCMPSMEKGPLAVYLVYIGVTAWVLESIRADGMQEEDGRRDAGENGRQSIGQVSNDEVKVDELVVVKLDEWEDVSKSAVSLE